ncbi:MAG: hypothetical protein J0I20_14195 [Chloroflexi bacterium]|nr:hypothetical protein [Chloroflexota bacterium]OJW02667.1 MAG: hypothetical protein BGO39_05345 [Chloroflexi bacterium 54-19]
MRKNLFLIGLAICSVVLIVLIVAGLAIQQTNATTKPLTQKDVETLAISYARIGGFEGEPTSVQSKFISINEIKARLDPFRTSADSEWLVVLKGKAVVNLVPSKNNPSQQVFDNMYIELSINGELIGTGSRNPGYEIDLNSPVPPIPDRWPGPVDNTPKS